MDREYKAATLFYEGYNCAQAVACTFADKVDVEVSEEDRNYMRTMVYNMYANPLKNKLNTLKSE